MKYLLSIIAVCAALSGCATTPGPEQMRSKWIGGDNASFNKDYDTCRMKADEQAPGAGTTAMTVLLWPVGLAMGITSGMQAENTMKLCMGTKGWTPAK